MNLEFKTVRDEIRTSAEGAASLSRVARQLKNPCRNIAHLRFTGAGNMGPMAMIFGIFRNLLRENQITQIGMQGRKIGRIVINRKQNLAN